MNSPAYRIITPRLILRCYHPTDVFLFAEAITNSLEHLLPWMPWAKNEPEPLQAKKERLRQFRGRFDLGLEFIYAIFNLDETRLVGSTGLHVRSEAMETGYWINKDFIGQGYATEAAMAMTRAGFEIMATTRMDIHCSVDNTRSAAVASKLGYTHEATLRQRGYAYGKPSDQMVWTLLPEEYPASPAAKFNMAAFDAAERQIL